jgi:hypothetical protein
MSASPPSLFTTARDRRLSAMATAQTNTPEAADGYRLACPHVERVVDRVVDGDHQDEFRDAHEH